MTTSIAILSNIQKQTEKAILIQADDRFVWVPKSLTTIDDNGVIFAPMWFAKKNGIGCFCYRGYKV
jgi:hypothetical protein